MTAWSEEFQRLALAAAIRGDLLDSVPLDPALFGPIQPTGPTSPRQRLCEAIVTYFGEYGQRPSPEALSQLALDAGARLGPEERAALEAEVAAVLRVAVADQRYVLDQVRAQVELRALSRGIVQAADLLAAGSSALGAARELLARAASPLAAAPGRTVRYYADAEARVLAWRRGDEYGERISTGLGGLDGALRGGPTRREAHYFLAPPKGAKTTFLMKVASSAARRRYGVYIATYEMEAVRMALRLDRMHAGATKGELSDDPGRLERALSNLRRVGSGEIVIDQCPPQQPGSVAKVAARVAQVRRAGGRVDVVVLDYLNIMGASRRETEKRHELARISRDVAVMAKELDVLVWSAALVNRQAVDKNVIRKTDIAEAFEVIAVADGMVAICATPSMVRKGIRRLYVAASREEADEVWAGDYQVDFSRMMVASTTEGSAESASLDSSDS